MFVTSRDHGNLALHVDDDETAVRTNRARLAERIGVAQVQFMRQVHGTGVAVVDEASDEDIADVDALITTTPGVAVAVLVADCVPIVITGAHGVAVVHAGRLGVAGNIVGATVGRLRALGAGTLRAHVGPAICGRCYEVPPDMQSEVAGVEAATLATTRAGTTALDLPAGVRAQLRRLDVEVAPDTAPCTLEDNRFFSHRRDAPAGRFAAVAMLLE